LWPAVRWLNTMLMMKSSQRYRLIYYAERIIAKLIRRDFQFSLGWIHLDGALFCFCVNRRAQWFSALKP
jgi:hypothetical protein